MSASSHSLPVTPAAIAGVRRSAGCLVETDEVVLHEVDGDTVRVVLELL